MPSRRPRKSSTSPSENAHYTDCGVTQALPGGRNMKLRTLAEFAWACGASVGGFEFVRGGRAARAARAAPRTARRNGRAPRAAA